MKTLVRAMLPVALLALSATLAHAQRLGPQVSWDDDTDLALGGRIEFGLGSLNRSEGAVSRMFGIVSFDYFFPDCDEGLSFIEVDCSYWEANIGVGVPLVVEGIDPYVGGGFNVAHTSFEFPEPSPALDADDTEVGLNLLGGIRFRLGALSSFAEARFELSGGEQFVLTFGALFGSR